MDLKIDNILIKAGNEHRYQYILLILTVIVWINVEFSAILLPFLEKEPEVDYTNPFTYEKITAQLNYTMCDQGNLTYEIVKSYEYSWVTLYHIECDKIKIGLMGSILFTGVMMGSFLFQFIGNYLGRKNSAVFGILSFTIVILGATFIENLYFSYLILFSAGLFGNLIALSTYILVSESVSSHKRAIFGSLINTGFSVCGILYILLIKYIENWRYVFYFAGMLSIINCILYFIFIHESAIYYLYKKDSKNFLLSLRKTAKYNGKTLIIEEEISKKGDHTDFNIIARYLDNEKQKVHSSKGRNKKIIKTESQKIEILIENSHTDEINSNFGDEKNSIHKNSFFDLVKFASIRYKFFILCWLWFCISGNYYGLTIYLKNLPGDIYNNGIIIYVFEGFSYFLAGIIVNIKFIGRKGSFEIFYIIAIICFLILTLFSIFDWYISNWSEIVLTFIARLGVAGVFNLLYTYSFELYPTSVRAQGIGLNSVSARLGSIISPVILEGLDKQYVNLIFASINLLCLFLLMFLPETLGEPLKDNIKEITDNKS